MAIVNQRWPRDLCPQTCVFQRPRNDIRQESPRTRDSTVIRQGRPLWGARISWVLPNTERLAKLRYYLEALDGFGGSVQIWDFNSFRPEGLTLPTADAETARVLWVHLGTRVPWSYAGLPSHWALDGTFTVAADAAAGATSVSFTGLQPDSLAVVQGQYVQIGRRLYLAAETASTDGSGNVTIQLVRPLVSAAPTGTVARFAEAACEMELIDQNFDQSSRAGEGMVTVSAAFLETVKDKT